MDDSLAGSLLRRSLDATMGNMVTWQGLYSVPASAGGETHIPWTPDTFVALAACLVAVVAVVPAFVATRHARRAADASIEQTRLQRDIAHQASLPRVWADVAPKPESRQGMFIRVGNSGASTALDVRLRIDPPILPGAQSAEKCVRAQEDARTGIASLTPGRTYDWYIGVAHEVIDANRAVTQHTLTLDAVANDGTPLHEQFPLRLGDMWRTWVGSSGTLTDVTKSVTALTAEVMKTRQVLEQQAE